MKWGRIWLIIVETLLSVSCEFNMIFSVSNAFALVSALMLCGITLSTATNATTKKTMKTYSEAIPPFHIPCHVSAAWELDTDGSFAACAKRHGATMGLAHSMATADEARVAIERGVTSFTHLFNAMPPLHHREGGAVSVALIGSGYGELIVDGLHVCPDMVALAYRCLGRDRTVLITDSMQGTGCPDGEYAIAGQPVILKNGRALTLDGALAGSTLNLWDGVKNLMQFADVSLGDAVLCATRNPAKMLGIEDLLGTIEVGKRADLLVVDEKNLQIEAVLCRGAWLTEPKGDLL